MDERRFVIAEEQWREVVRRTRENGEEAGSEWESWKDSEEGLAETAKFLLDLLYWLDEALFMEVWNGE